MNQLTLKGYVHNVTKTSLTRSGATNYIYTLFFLFTIPAFRSTLFKKTFPTLTNYNITICSSHCQPERKEDYENMNQLTLKGYVQNATKTSLSRSGATSYFNFSLQVNESRKRRAVCYDASKQPLLEGSQDSKQPITLLSITEKPSLLDPAEQHVIVSKRSRIALLNNDQCTLQYGIVNMTSFR